MTGVAALLARSELPDGGWNAAWAGGAAAPFLWGNPLMDGITVTGHHLEWIALSPTVARPEPAIVRRAVAALERQVAALPPLKGRLFKLILPCSHAARALCMLRGVEPFQAWRLLIDREELVSGSAGLRYRDRKTK